MWRCSRISSSRRVSPRAGLSRTGTDKDGQTRTTPTILSWGLRGFEWGDLGHSLPGTPTCTDGGRASKKRRKSRSVCAGRCLVVTVSCPTVMPAPEYPRTRLNAGTDGRKPHSGLSVMTSQSRIALTTRVSGVTDQFERRPPGRYRPSSCAQHQLCSVQDRPSDREHKP
jgi:hypothetical protein